MDELNHYDLGDPVTITSTFALGGVAVDPTTVSATAVAPDGTETTYTYPTNITKPVVGTYQLIFLPDQAGQWFVIVHATGTTVAGSERHEFVIDPRLPSDLLNPDALTSLEKASRYLGMQGVALRAEEEDQLHDLADSINAYSAAAAAYCDRNFHLETAAAHTFSYDGSGVLTLMPYELRSATSIVLYTNQPAGSQWTLTTSDYTLEPRERSNLGTYTSVHLPALYLAGRPFRVGWSWYPAVDVTITGDWGPLTVPSDVERAVLIAVANNYRNPGGFSQETFGPVATVEAAAPVAVSLPPDARALLAPYRRYSI